MPKGNLRLALPLSLLVSAVILYLVVRDIRWDETLAALRQISLGRAVLCGGGIGVGLLARGLRWHAFLVGALPYRRALRLTFLAFLLNNLLPLRLGDLARVEAVSHGAARVPRTTALSVAAAERLLDLLTIGILFLLILPGLAAVPDEIRGTVSLLAWAAAGAVLVLVVLALLLRERVQALVESLEGRVALLRRVRLGEIVANLFDGLAVLNRPGFLAAALVWNAVAWGALVVAYQVLMVALFPAATAAEAALLVIAIALSISVPTTVASLGLIEAGAVLALTSQGYAYEAAFAIGLTSHVVTLVIYTLMGGYAVWSEAWNWPKAAPAARPAPDGK